MTVPNMITLLRIALVPVIVWAMLTGQRELAFFSFLVAGASDAVDGAVARAFNQQSELGTALDPIADKAMLVSVYVLLAWLGDIPIWLAILVFSRDVLIIAGLALAFFLGRTIEIRPILVSKANTFAQILLAALVLGLSAFALEMPVLRMSLEWIVAALTTASAIAYTVQGMRVLANGDSEHGNSTVEGH